MSSENFLTRKQNTLVWKDLVTQIYYEYRQYGIKL